MSWIILKRLHQLQNYRGGIKLAFVITQNEIELVILENDKAYSKQRRFFDSLSSILISTGYFSSVLYNVKNVATDDVEMILQYKNSNLGIRLRSRSSVIQCVRVDNVASIVSVSEDSSYFSGTGIKTILFRYSETFFQLIIVGLSQSAGGETVLINAKVDIPLVKQNPSTAIYDAYGRQVNFNGGIWISRMTFQNEILLTKPLV